MILIFSLFWRPFRWIRRRFQPQESFKLTEEGALLRCLGKHVVERLNCGDITEWQVILEPGADVVRVGLKEGFGLLWSDREGKLLPLLKRIAPNLQGKDLRPEDLRPVKASVFDFGRVMDNGQLESTKSKLPR